MSDFIIDKNNRRVILTVEGVNPLMDGDNQTIIQEYDKLTKKFLPNTVDTYECELVLLDVEEMNENNEPIGIITKAYARRIGIEDWIMAFNTEDYIV